MSFDSLEYYKALNGESSQEGGTWHIDYDKSHAFSVSSDIDPLDGSNNKISLPPSISESNIINTFSDKLGQKLKNTKITDNGDGTESVELELEDRIVTIIVDQSGSMTWNDNDKLRHDVMEDLVDKIEINYPGDIKYNLIEYGADIINVLFFGVIDDDGIDPNDVDSLASMIKIDEKANYDGIRIIRNDDHYPTSILDGDVVDDGFISRIKDINLTEGQTYYYTVYTYDKNLKFSEGTRIKVTPQERIVPRSTSVFKTMVDSEDLTKGIPFTGTGVNRDDNTIGIWHMDEGEGSNIYDFSDTSATLVFNKENPIWYESRFVPAGASGLFFDGDVDKASYVDTDGDFIITNSESNNTFTFIAWVYPYLINTTQYIFSISSSTERNVEVYINESGQLTASINGISNSFSTSLNAYQWQHISVVYNANNPSQTELIINIDNEEESLNLSVNNLDPSNVSSILTYSSTMSVVIGGSNYVDAPYRGKITEVSFHNIDRDASYISFQTVNSPIFDENEVEIDSELIGIKDDNGDRLVVLKYEIPRDYNFVGGEVVIVKNEKNIPSWEEDGTVIYQQSISTFGEFFVSDADNFSIEEKYYYRLFSKNSLGNVSFLSDSPSLEIEIPEADTSDYFLSISSPIYPPQSPSIGQLITNGNEKSYLRWKQLDTIDSTISRTRIYYSPNNFPVVDKNGGSDGKIVFTGLVTDEKFIHVNISNDTNAFYTIVNVDKYGRSSNYNSDGEQVEDFLHATTIPSSSANEQTFPLNEIDNINYELIDENSITIGWDLPTKSAEDIESFFDQTVFIYGSIMDEFGDPVPNDTPIKMKITSSIKRESQADNVFSDEGPTDFEDIDAYDFFVTRTPSGFFKAILRMTTDVSIMSQIRDATFNIQMQVLIPKTGGYKESNSDDLNIDPIITEYVSLIEQLSDEISGDTEPIVTSNNFYEYSSKSISVHYTNPWEIELVNKNNKKVSQRCYGEETNALGKIFLTSTNESFNGIYMKASAPFIARAKVKYKGEPIESGNIQIAVWDADSSELCRNAFSDTVPHVSWEGDKLQVSETVLPPDNLLPVIQGTEETYKGSGEFVDISYVDISLYAPDLPQAVRLYVKGEQSGYSSIKDIYILFQNILQIEVETEAPRVDGKDIGEQKANVFLINPDYPNYQINDYDKSLITYPEDFSIAQWDIRLVQTGVDADGSRPRNLYSTDNVPLTNGVYSFTRNGVARNVFLGPIQKGDLKIDETHEIKTTVVFKGLTNFAKDFVSFSYIPQDFDKTSARFLMEVDGGWRDSIPNQTYGGGGWLNSAKSGNPLWLDGINYKKIKISRNPRTALTSDFASADCFRTCAAQDDNELLELSSGQVVQVTTNNGSLEIPGDLLAPQAALYEVEILHGEISEIEDPYTGVHYLEVGEEGFIDQGSAFIELNNEEDSDTTYFYIRINGFAPNAKKVFNDGCDPTKRINDCTCLATGGLTQCDFPEWSELLYVSGNTTVFVNNKPLVLNGGGTMSTGIPPCPICLNEPLISQTISRKVIDYVINEINGELIPIITEAEDNNFFGNDNKTLIKHTSDIDIRIVFSWRGDPLPDGTPIFTSVGDNKATSLFLASQSVYFTQTDEDEGHSYVDVSLSARRPVEVTTSEQVEIYSNYDELEKTDRHIGQIFTLTIDKKEDIIETPVVSIDPSVEDAPVLPTGSTPFSGTMDRYNISTNEWDSVTSMTDPRGNAFYGTVGDNIYYMGGLRNNSLNISNKNERYDILKDEWSDASIMPEGRFAGMSVTLGNDIYTIGGIFADQTSGGTLSVATKVSVYHANTDLWEDLEEMPIIDKGGAFEDALGVAFGNAQHVVIDGKNYIYIIGGVKDVIANTGRFEIREYNQRILRYSIENNSWEYSDVLRSNELNSYERISPLSIVFDNKIIVFNGAIELGDQFIYPSEDFYINISKNFSTPSSGEWVNFGSGFMGDFPVPKFQTAMIRYDLNPSTDQSDYYLFGGSNENSPSLDLVEKIIAQDDVFGYESSYDNQNVSASSLSSLPIEKHGASAVFSDSDGSPYVYFMGGYTINREEDFVDISFDI